jgi:phospholipid/cholesterol/gamma-HCH transport system substrate-binding protein
MRTPSLKKIPNWVIGLVFIVVIAVGSYVAFTKKVPWGGGTSYDVVFNSAQNVRVNSPVRIAGVEVGKVSGIEPLATSDREEQVSAQGEASAEGEGTMPQTGAVVTLELQDAALPLKEDATFKLRPRLFLEGNLFVELRPGSPSAPSVDEGHTFPPSQTANSVQLDQILTSTLQGDTRKDLRVLLDQFGQALVDEGGGDSFRELYRASEDSFKYTSQVNEALLGENPHDLSGLIRNLDTVVRALIRNETALKDTVTNLATVSGSFAAESEALEQAIIELPQVIDASEPAFANLNAAFPPLRAFSREALPGVRSTEPMLIETTPLLEQVRLLSRPQELRGTVAALRPTVPRLARLVRRTPPFLEQSRALASCFNQVIIPWSEDTVRGGGTYRHQATDPVYKETAYGLVGIAGESRSGDANGQYIRVAGGGGTNTVQSPLASSGETLAGVTPFPLEGVMPAIESSAKTPFRPNEPCENQETPNLNAGVPGQPPTQSGTGEDPLPDPLDPLDPLPLKGEAADIVGDGQEAIRTLIEAAELEDEGEKREAKRTEREGYRLFQRFYKRYGN